MARPQALRHRLADSASQSSPLPTCSTARCHTASGDTSSGELDQPEATAQYQQASRASGSTQPRRRRGM